MFYNDFFIQQTFIKHRLCCRQRARYGLMTTTETQSLQLRPRNPAKYDDLEGRNFKTVFGIKTERSM